MSGREAVDDKDREPTEESRLLLALPELPPPEDPAALVLPDPDPPIHGRPCGNPGCDQLVGKPYPGTPVRHKGYCAACGTEYSLLPQLSPGEQLDGGRYKVRGCLAHGGLGWIYLAVDTRLLNRPVVLKGLINANDPEAQQRMLQERDQLIAVSHESVVRIFDYVSHRPDSRKPADDYIVMEYIGGKSLRKVVEEAKDGGQPFGSEERLKVEHVARYGCQILNALTALHERGLVYSDMKPDNVIHRGTRVVLIDLGGVQRMDEPDLRVITRRYAAPETISGRPPTVAHDIYTVGRTLEELARCAEGRASGTGLGHESFNRLVRRAVRRDPRLRFSSAAEMSEQLEGVLRELLSLRTKRQYNRPSDVFDPTPALLDAGLASVPGPAHWRGRGVGDYRRTVTSPPLIAGCPTPSQVAAGLPVPRPRRDDPAITQLRLPAPQDPRAVVRQLERYLEGEGRRRSAEVRLRLCRAHLSIREELPDSDPGRDAELEKAAQRLKEAESILGASRKQPPSDWRLAWHRGLMHLGRSEVQAAEEHFAEVYDALPGEYAPKLALGYCVERCGKPERAQLLYHAVWQRNPQQASAAFGLARIHLAGGDRKRAAEALDGVPPMSRHYDAARIAAVRIRAARLSTESGNPSDGLPERHDLAAVRKELPGLALDGGAKSGPERDRLTAEVREWALDWMQRATERAGSPAKEDGARDGDRGRLAELSGDLFGSGGKGKQPTVRGLRILLSHSFLRLAQLPGATPADREHLVDCSNAVLPRTWFIRPAEEQKR